MYKDNTIHIEDNGYLYVCLCERYEDSDAEEEIEDLVRKYIFANFIKK